MDYVIVGCEVHCARTRYARMRQCFNLENHYPRKGKAFKDIPAYEQIAAKKLSNIRGGQGVVTDEWQNRFDDLAQQYGGKECVIPLLFSGSYLKAAACPMPRQVLT